MSWLQFCIKLETGRYNAAGRYFIYRQRAGIRHFMVYYPTSSTQQKRIISNKQQEIVNKTAISENIFDGKISTRTCMVGTE